MRKQTSMIPFVVERRSDGERTYDIYSRLLEDRIVFLGEEIDADLANSVVAQLLLLDQKDPKSPIYLYINSPGGSITAGLAIYDTMQFIRPKVITVCVGYAASMAAVLLASGAPGQRKALPNSHIMIHEPRSHGTHETTTVTDQEIDFELIKKMRVQLTSILASRTGKPEKTILKDCQRDKWMSPPEAKDYGLIDEIVVSKPTD